MYYGLFGDRIFEDFESKFLKKNIQGALLLGVLNPVNWVKLFAGIYGRSDLSAEYYDKHIFEGKTFGDLAARKGPMILMNVTDMTHGLRIGFNQDAFDVIDVEIHQVPSKAGSVRPLARSDPVRTEVDGGVAARSHNPARRATTRRTRKAS